MLGTATFTVKHTDEEKRQYCLSRGIDPALHCCLDTAFHIAHPVETPHQGRNRVVDWIASWDEYLVPVAHDGYAATLMRFCPWCGARLPESKRELWYQSLYQLGYSDPGEDDIPPEFHSDRWWRHRRA